MINWRNTYLTPKFFIVDARILALILPTLVHFRWYTVVPTIIITIVLYFIEKRLEMDVASALRLIRSTLVGRLRPANTNSKRGRIDYESKWNSRQ
ncbi:IcmT/TraK family protein [Thalassospira xianhensis]|uniref:Intracellular multiplication protein IcmT n=2 Tax=Thalassospira TaxID=168934 RepID=A0A285TRB2_9PROT|nr:MULTISPECIES: IcmT/TraK family protein [Thalassospira]RCK07615.1 hypothetical protein TH5_00625 [Thalassospira xianhensis MCCC 1A02616]SOC25928.1 hypothetical protein SAMN05428964_10514 [Thalassospira xiamenensis]